MINYARIGEALIHPTQRRILEAALVFEGPVSPKMLAEWTREPLGNVSYHVGILAGVRKDSPFAECPILELVDTAQRRGAVEHFYRLTRKARLS